MSNKKNDWDRVMKYAAGVAKDIRNPNKGGNPHLTWGSAQKKAWQDPRVVKRKAEYHIKHTLDIKKSASKSHKTTDQPKQNLVKTKNLKTKNPKQNLDKTKNLKRSRVRKTATKN